jgi:hypothetical protein
MPNFVVGIRFPFVDVSFPKERHDQALVDASNL